MTLDSIRQQLARRASRAIVGGIRPSDSHTVSWIGNVTACLPGETWPTHEGKPLDPVAQLNLTEVPYLPSQLKDLALVTLFVSLESLPWNHPSNGSGWALRAYRSLDDLERISSPRFERSVRPFPLQWEEIEDFPSHEDIPIELPPEIDGSYYDHFETAPGLKVGGWPSLIQSEVFWAPHNQHPADPEFSFQVDSDEKAGLCWGDAGVAYLGRGTGGAADEWAFEWQCY